MQKLIFTNSKNESIDLTSAPFGIVEWEGFSNVDMEVQSQNVPFVDGSIYIDNLLNDRQLTVTIAIEDNGNLRKRYELRRELIRILNPKFGQGILRYKNNYLEKQIQCIADTPIFENHNSNDVGTVKASVTFTACQPYWEDLEDTVTFLSLTEQPVIINDGDVASQVRIDVEGQSTNVRIKNVTTGSQIGLSGLINQPVKISTEFGKKTVKGSVMNWRNVFGGQLNDIASAGEISVIVGSDGAILRSEDGINWFSQISPTVENLNCVDFSFAFNLFVACGADGVIVYSEDGKTWHLGTNTSSKNINSISHSDTKMIAVGDDGTILTSTDGMNFVAMESPTTRTLYCIYYNDAVFVATGANGTILTSTDGSSWTSRTSGTTYSIRSIAYNENTNEFLAVGNEGLIIRSSNLQNWTVVTPLAYLTLNSVIYNDNLNSFIIVGDYGTIITGLDEFTRTTLDEDKEIIFIGFIKEYSSMFIGGAGVLYSSSNAEDWLNILNLIDSQLHDVVYIADFALYIASSSSGKIIISEDGDIWKVLDIGINVNLFSLTYNPNSKTLIGVGTGGTIVRSFDGRNWEIVVNGIAPYKYFLLTGEYEYLLIDDESKLIIAQNDETGSLYKVCYCETQNLYVAVGFNGKIITSRDGSNWSERASGTNETLNDVVEKDGTIVAVGNNGTILYSYDAINWVSVNSSTNQNLNGVCSSMVSKIKFLTVGNNGAVLTSANGKDWREFNSGINVNLNSVCYSEYFSQFVAVGNDGTIVTSVNGRTWNDSASGTSQSYESIIFSNALNRFIAVGSKGVIMNSYISEEQNLINRLSSNSDVNFSLEVGENVIRVSCEDGNPRITIKFKNKYIGV